MPSSQAVAGPPQPLATDADAIGAGASLDRAPDVKRKKAREIQQPRDRSGPVAVTGARRGSDLRSLLVAPRSAPFVLLWDPFSGPKPLGYAQDSASFHPVPAAPKTTYPREPTSVPVGTSTRGEWGFLNDSHMSIEDKLFLFMKTVQKKNDAELDKKMKEYRDKYVKDSDSGGGLFGFLGKALSGIFTGGLVKDIFEQVGGLVLSAGATAFGLTPLGPLLASVGKDLGRYLGSEIASVVVPARSSGSGSSSDKKEGGTPDEKLMMLEIQRLVEKQNQMFNCISNVLKNMHDTAMNAIGNIR